MGLVVDGYDLEGIGFIVGNEIDPTRQAPSRSHPFVVRPYRAAAAPAARRGQHEPRTVQVGGYLRAASAAALQGREDELKHRLLTPSEVAVYLSERPDRIWDVRFEDVEVRTLRPARTATKERVTLSGVALHPMARSSSKQSVAVDTQSNVPVGTARSRPVITIVGPVTDPSIVYRDAAGNVVEQMDLAVTLADSSESLVVDSERLDVEDGTGTRRLDVISAGDFVVIDPADAAGFGGTPPSIEVTGSPGSATAEYYERWR